MKDTKITAYIPISRGTSQLRHYAGCVWLVVAYLLFILNKNNPYTTLLIKKADFIWFIL